MNSAHSFRSWSLTAWIGFATLLAGMFFSRPASAYAWMIRHDYAACGACHADPSGGGLLTPYGTALGDLALRTQYKHSEEPGKSAGFLWGAWQPPEALLLGGAFRAMSILTKVGDGATTASLIPMQADLRAQLRLGGFRASGSVGVVNSEGSGAAIAGSLISREHWLAYGSEDDSLLVRAGRITLPFGIRSIEHTLFVRNATRTDLNDTQQHGVALFFSRGQFRAELMGILGNYQFSPDAYRERGYSAYAELLAAARTALGVSSLVTHAARDISFQSANTRQAHGVFLRSAPVRPLVLLAEADLLVDSPSGARTRVGSATMLQADLEPVQGLHLITTSETLSHGASGVSFGGWLGLAWFFLPHIDARVDVMERSLSLGNSRIPVSAYMFQLHTYL
jgi:hypothetical protein